MNYQFVFIHEKHLSKRPHALTNILHNKNGNQLAEKLLDILWFIGNSFISNRQNVKIIFQIIGLNGTLMENYIEVRKIKLIIMLFLFIVFISILANSLHELIKNLRR